MTRNTTEFSVPKGWWFGVDHSIGLRERLQIDTVIASDFITVIPSSNTTVFLKQDVTATGYLIFKDFVGEPVLQGWVIECWSLRNFVINFQIPAMYQRTPSAAFPE